MHAHAEADRPAAQEPGAPPAWPADAVLERLPQATDEATMRTAFGELLRGHGVRVLGCRVERVKYRPGRNCTLSYRLALARRDDGAAFEQRVSARLCRDGDSARRLAKADPSRWPASPAGPAVCTLPALDLLAWWWPNDPVLAAPAVLADARRLRRDALPEVLAALGVDTVAGHDVDVLQYVPEQRLTARVTLHGTLAARGPRGHGLDRVVYAKASPPPGGAAAHAALRALQASPAARAGQLVTPAPLAWQPACGLHWQSARPGAPLGSLPAAQRVALAGPLGAQLAALHATPLDGLPTAGLDELRARLAEVTATLALALPAEAPRLARLATRLGHGLRHIADAPLATLHGDLHANNVLADADRLALIDLDDLHRGAAVLELGGWVAEGMARALLDGDAPDRDALAWAGLLDGHARAGGTPPSPAALAWAAAWNLLTQRAWRCVVNLKPGRLALVPALLALAEVLADAPGLECP